MILELCSRKRKLNINVGFVIENKDEIGLESNDLGNGRLLTGEKAQKIKIPMNLVSIISGKGRHLKIPLCVFTTLIISISSNKYGSNLKFFYNE